MAESWQKPYGINITSDRVKVYTGTGTRHFRSQRAWVYLRPAPGEKTAKPIKCCTGIHQKRSTAQACGERTARALLKQKETS